MNTEKKIASYEDACRVLNIQPINEEVFNIFPKEDQRSMLAYHKLTVITRALNNGWKPNWPVTTMSAGAAVSAAGPAGAATGSFAVPFWSAAAAEGDAACADGAVASTPCVVPLCCADAAVPVSNADPETAISNVALCPNFKIIPQSSPTLIRRTAAWRRSTGMEKTVAQAVPAPLP